MEFEIKATKIVNAKTLKIFTKPVDSGTYVLVDAEGAEIKSRDGYVPHLIPGDHYGDYLNLEIDLETGRILNWKPPTARQLAAFVDDEDE